MDGAAPPYFQEGRHSSRRRSPLRAKLRAADRLTLRSPVPVPEGQLQIPKTTTLHRPVGQKELDLSLESGSTAFPPRLEHQPIFYPVLNGGYAIQIARDWNTKDEVSGYVGYVARFEVRTDYLDAYEAQVTGGGQHAEDWIPSEDLEEFNRSLVGTIEVTHEFRPKAGLC